MNLEGIMLSEIRETKTNTILIDDLTYRWNLKDKFTETVDWWLSRG